MIQPARAHDAARYDEDPFYWGTRLRYVETPEGRRLEEIPLTRDDILDPQEGDMMVHSAAHGELICNLASMLAYWFRRRGREMTVFDSVKILWGIPGVKDPAPDITIIPGSRDPDRRFLHSYSLAEHGTLPCLVIEVISERYADIDYRDKVRLYERVGIPEYLILDIEREPLELVGFRLGTDGRYRRSSLRRRWLSRTTGLLFAAGAGELDLEIHDVETGERVLDVEGYDRARQAEFEARQYEARARQVAERRAQKAAAAQQAEAEARREAEQRIEELKAELERLRRERGS